MNEPDPMLAPRLLGLLSVVALGLPFPSRAGSDQETPSGPDESELARVARLVRERNRNEIEITRVLGRPALIGHLGEYIAARIFDIELATLANNPGNDGIFQSGPLAGRTVNIKFYAKREGLLDIGKTQPDFYLVLAGPRSAASSSRPWVIHEVFLFKAVPLLERLQQRGVKIGTATSVTLAEWDAARIHPASPGSPLELTPRQHDALDLFRGDP